MMLPLLTILLAGGYHTEITTEAIKLMSPTPSSQAVLPNESAAVKTEMKQATIKQTVAKQVLTKQAMLARSIAHVQNPVQNSIPSASHLKVVSPEPKTQPGQLPPREKQFPEIILDEPELSTLERFFLKLSPLKTFEIKHFSVAMPHLPSHLDGLRVVQLSDLQCYEYAPTDYWKNMIRKVHQLDPDVIVITGDMIHFGKRHLKQTQDILNYLPKAKADGSPVVRVACMGNHDYFDREAKPGHFDAEDGQSVLEILQNSDFTVLIDNAITVFEDKHQEDKLQNQEHDKKQPTGLTISAIDDYEHIEMTDGKSLEQSFSQLFDQVPSQQAHLMLSHNPHPDIVNYAAAQGNKAPALILSGHTHGGQWSSPIPVLKQCMDFARAKVVHGPFSNRYLIGGYAVNNSYVYVNAGTGSSIRAFNHNFLPLRLGSNPEITVLDLTPADSNKTELKSKI